MRQVALLNLGTDLDVPQARWPQLVQPNENCLSHGLSVLPPERDLIARLPRPSAEPATNRNLTAGPVPIRLGCRCSCAKFRPPNRFRYLNARDARGQDRGYSARVGTEESWLPVVS